MTFSVWAEGIDDLNTVAADLQTASGRVGEAGAALVRKSAFDIERDGKAFCQVDTGNLRSTIGVDFAGDGRSGQIQATIGPTANYGGFVEWGTERMAPHAYMGPALDRHSGTFVDAVAKLSDPLAGGSA